MVRAGNLAAFAWRFLLVKKKTAFSRRKDGRIDWCSRILGGGKMTLVVLIWGLAIAYRFSLSISDRVLREREFFFGRRW